MSEIRQLLAAAQQAELRGDLTEATRLLRKAASWYSDRALGARAETMMRHAARLEGRVEPLVLDRADDFGFGDELAEPGALATVRPASPVSCSPPPAQVAMLDQRSPALADPRIDAWCSFCCRPAREAGALVTGPTGAFMCGRCLRTSAGLIGVPLSGSAPELGRGPTLDVLLPSQQRAVERLRQRQGRVVLVVGPPASGKSTLLGRLGSLARPPYTHLPEKRVIVDLPSRLVAEEEGRLLAWLEADAGRSLVIGACGRLPAPSLVLAGEQGAEPVYDTRALASAVDTVSEGLLSQVDQVVALEAPDAAALEVLARGLLEGRGVELPQSAIHRLVAIAVDSGRGAHEVAALARRISPGRYAER